MASYSSVAAQSTTRQVQSTTVPEVPYWITVWKEGAEAAAATGTLVALIFAAIWFLQRRHRYPRANVEHRVVDWCEDRRRIIHIHVRIANVGDVVLRPTSLMVRVQQLVPMSVDISEALSSGDDPVSEGDSEFYWPLLSERTCTWEIGSREIEPGEADECHFDFNVAQHVKMIEVYSHLSNVSKRERPIGWNTTTVHSCQ